MQYAGHWAHEDAGELMPDVPSATQAFVHSSCADHVRARDGASAFIFTHSQAKPHWKLIFP